MSDQGSDSSAPSVAGTDEVPAATTTSSPLPGKERDWTFEVTDRVESVVGAVRDKTTVPITKVARGVVFGLVAGTLGLAALILLIVALLRVIDVYLPFEPYGRRIWIGLAALGAIFVGAGAFCWSKRTTSKSS